MRHKPSSTMPCVTGQNVGRLQMELFIYVGLYMACLERQGGRKGGRAGLEHFEAPSESPIFPTGKFAAHPSSWMG